MLLLIRIRLKHRSDDCDVLLLPSLVQNRLITALTSELISARVRGGLADAALWPLEQIEAPTEATTMGKLERLDCRDLDPYFSNQGSTTQLHIVLLVRVYSNTE